jgi:DNA primase small subunit
VFSYLYPRLDANVSKQRNHLLKSPFAVHPKTGRVCVPVNASRIEEFDPFTVPTLGQLQDELNKMPIISALTENKEAEAEAEEEPAAASALETKEKDVERTSMKKYVTFFENSFVKPLCAAAKEKKRREQETNAAYSGDW